MRRLQPVRQRAHNPALPVSRPLLECSLALPVNPQVLPVSLPVFLASRLLLECNPALPVNPQVLPVFRRPERVLLRH
jgi:hypothetical protein